MEQASNLSQIVINCVSLAENMNTEHTQVK